MKLVKEYREREVENLGPEANRVDPDQAALTRAHELPDLDLLCLQKH